ATKYPSFRNASFDPNWVDVGPDKIAGNADDTYSGPKSPIKPVFRAVGATSIPSASNLWVILQLVVFDRGTKLPNLPAFDPAYGYPSVVVLQTSSAAGLGNASRTERGHRLLHAAEDSQCHVRDDPGQPWYASGRGRHTDPDNAGGGHSNHQRRLQREPAGP